MEGEGDKVQPLDAMKRSGTASSVTNLSGNSGPNVFDAGGSGGGSSAAMSRSILICKTDRDRHIMQMLHNQGLQIKAEIKALESLPKTPETEQRLIELWDRLDETAALNARIIQGQRPRR